MRHDAGIVILATVLLYLAPPAFGQVRSVSSDTRVDPPASPSVTASAATSAAASAFAAAAAADGNTPVDPAAVPDAREWFGSGVKWADWSRMTGDWDRMRTDLEHRGFALDLSTVSDFSTISGASRRVRGLERGLTTLGLNFDLEKLAGWAGASVLVQYQGLAGANAALYSALAQGFSNIDADRFGRLGEAWLQFQASSAIRVKLGRIDANKEFAFVENGSEFMNSSMGYSPTIVALPTYPDPHAGLVTHVDLGDRLYVAAGAFNSGPATGVADFGAVFGIGEVGVKWEAVGGGRLGIGYWGVGGRRADPDDAVQTIPIKTGGAYLVFDQTLWADEQDGHEQSIGAFLQAGTADPALSTLAYHVGGGLSFRGLVSVRPDDSIGFGVTVVGARAPVMAGHVTHAETNVGAFYRLAVTKWMALKPDVQVVRRAGGDSTRRALVAGTLRVEFGF